MVYQPNKAIHPGHVISRTLERDGMSQKNLSERTGLTEKHLSQIINGNASITVETALLLENALGGSASFWINLEKNYQETTARLERSSFVRNETKLLSTFPYLELVQRGYVEQTSNREKRVENLWKFYGVNSLLAVRDIEPVAFRKRANSKIKSEAIAAWLRCGELESKKQNLPTYSETTLKQGVERIKALFLKPANEYSRQIRDILKESGVALEYVPHFAGTGVSGSVRWINENPLMQLSLLGAYADMFWFNLFHEIGHLLLHGKKEKFIEFNDKTLSTVQDKEKEADDFATNELINPKVYAEFIERGEFSKLAIRNFSNDLGMDPGIVAGRLCHEKHVTWKDVASLRPRLKFTDKE